VTLIECTAQALSEQDTSYCDPNTQLTTITPAFGAVPTATFFAKRVLETGDGLVDCKARAGACILLATSGGSGYIGGFVSTVAAHRRPRRTIPAPERRPTSRRTSTSRRARGGGPDQDSGSRVDAADLRPVTIRP